MIDLRPSKRFRHDAEIVWYEYLILRSGRDPHLQLTFEWKHSTRLDSVIGITALTLSSPLAERIDQRDPREQIAPSSGLDEKSTPLSRNMSERELGRVSVCK